MARETVQVRAVKKGEVSSAECDSVTEWPASGDLIVMAPGTRVKIGPKGEIDALIAEVVIGHGQSVKYRVAWWSGNERRTDLLDLKDLSDDPRGFGDILQIGFRQ